MLPIHETLPINMESRYEYRCGKNVHSVWYMEYGFKTRNSKRKTWNASLIISGPKEWKKVMEEWQWIKKHTK